MDSDEFFWIDWFLGLKGHNYFCDVDQDFITDRFNLTGLAPKVPYFSHALEMICDQLEDVYDDSTRQVLDKSARHLYGLIHARYILTTRGLAKMQEKFSKFEFGRCPRVLCDGQALLPVGIANQPGLRGVKLFCPRCEDVYTPKSSKHLTLDGAFFGTSFPHMFLQVYPQLVPEKRAERYVPRIFGFRVHQHSQILSDPSPEFAKKSRADGKFEVIDFPRDALLSGQVQGPVNEEDDSL